MKLSLIVIASFFLYNPSLFGEESTDNLELTFNPAEVSNIKAKLITVNISGESSKEIDVQIANEDILYKKEEKILVIKNKDFIKRSKVSNKGKSFSLQVVLPYGLVQLPLTIKELDNGKIHNYGISLLSNKSSVELQSQQKISFASDKAQNDEHSNTQNTPNDSPNNRVSFGVGYNYLRFQQKMVTPYTSDLQYESFKGPGFYLSYLGSFTDKWLYSVEVKNAVGSTRTSANVSVKEGSYQWLTSSYELIYLSDKSPLSLFSAPLISQLQIRFGLQYHIEPYLQRVAASEVSVKTNDLAFLSLGVGKNIETASKKWLGEVFLRLQYPIHSGSNFRSSDFFSFDGSVGLSRQIAERWYLGGYWYGQYQSFNVAGIKDDVTGFESHGNQQLFYSNIEVRTSYFW